MQHPQSPIIATIAGGREIDFDHQERSAWGAVADGCEDALMFLHSQHPERHQFLAMLLECRQAAGRQAAPAQLQTV